MDDRALYATILGIGAPWEVTRVELDEGAKTVHVWLAEGRSTRFCCPECQVAELLDTIGVPGIWFPLGIGVSRTQYVYAIAIPLVAFLTVRTFQRERIESDAAMWAS